MEQFVKDTVRFTVTITGTVEFWRPENEAFEDEWDALASTTNFLDWLHLNSKDEDVAVGGTRVKKCPACGKLSANIDRCEHCDTRIPVPAVIEHDGSDGREPYARLLDGRRKGQLMPMGWNAGKVIPIGTRGTAVYVSTVSAGLWSFQADEERS